MSKANLIYERAYWRDPVQVFAGITWLVIGFGFGVIVGLLAT